MLAVTRLYDVEKVAQFPVEFRLRRPMPAVARELEIHGRREGSGFSRHVPYEMDRLVPPAPAEREEMIGAPADAGFLGCAPVPRESPVDMVRAFGGLDVSEVDTLARQLRPGDVPLVVRDVDSVEVISVARTMPPVVGVRRVAGARQQDHRGRDEHDPLTQGDCHDRERTRRGAPVNR